MLVRRLRLSDFSAFKSADLELVDGLNVFLGINGTGKTYVLRLIYLLLEAARIGTVLGNKLASVFRPGDDHLGRLFRRIHHARALRARYGTDRAKVELQLDRRQLGFELSSRTGRLIERNLQWLKPKVLVTSRAFWPGWPGLTVESMEGAPWRG
jgi:hypothetical protein